MKKKLKGFTLVELLAAMAIIAILIALAGFGISIALRNSRNSQREETLSNLQLAINDYYTKKSAYPASATGAGSSTQIVLKDSAGTTVGEAVPVSGATKSAASTSTSGTVYCYGATSTGYTLCALQEGGDWYSLSTGNGACPTSGTACPTGTSVGVNS